MQVYHIRSPLLCLCHHSVISTRLCALQNISSSIIFLLSLLYDSFYFWFNPLPSSINTNQLTSYAISPHTPALDEWKNRGKIYQRNWLYDPLQFFFLISFNVVTTLICFVMFLFFFFFISTSSSCWTMLRETESEHWTYIQYTIWYGNYPLFVLAKKTDKHSKVRWKWGVRRVKAKGKNTLYNSTKEASLY